MSQTNPASTTTTGHRSRTVRKFMNAHGHPRIGGLMKMIVPLISERYYACVAMPNPKDFLITSTERLIEYHRQLNELSEGKVRWLMKLYFTETLTPREIELAMKHPDFAGLKYYPRGLTTGSHQGISDPKMLTTPGTNPFEVLKFMASTGKPVSWHGADGFDADGTELDIYDQEKHFYTQTFPRILDVHPNTVHIGEHLSTSWGTEFFRNNAIEDDDRLGCTITAHHPFIDRRDVHRGGFRPNLWCYPAVHRSEHRDEVRRFSTEGHSYVMAGDDGAGHPREAKECGCCAGGVFTVGTAVELYTQLFDEMGALERLEAFGALNGPRFYGIEPSTEFITLTDDPWQPRASFFCDDGTEVVGYQQPDRTGDGPPPLTWRLAASA